MKIWMCKECNDDPCVLIVKHATPDQYPECTFAGVAIPDCKWIETTLPRAVERIQAWGKDCAE